MGVFSELSESWYTSTNHQRQCSLILCTDPDYGTHTHQSVLYWLRTVSHTHQSVLYSLSLTLTSLYCMVSQSHTHQPVLYCLSVSHSPVCIVLSVSHSPVCIVLSLSLTLTSPYCTVSHTHQSVVYRLSSNFTFSNDLCPALRAQEIVYVLHIIKDCYFSCWSLHRSCVTVSVTLSILFSFCHSVCVCVCVCVCLFKFMSLLKYLVQLKMFHFDHWRCTSCLIP